MKLLCRLQYDSYFFWKFSYNINSYVNITSPRKLSHIHRYTPVLMEHDSFSAESKNINNVPIVIMHGLFGSKMNWRSLAKIFSKRTNYRVITVDARNHGSSPHSSGMSYYHMADDIMYFLQKHGIKKAVLMGHSMGGRAVMATALIEPSFVEKLFVFDVSPLNVLKPMSTLPNVVKALKNVNIPSNFTISEGREKVDAVLTSVVEELGVRQFLLTNLVKEKDGFSWRVNLDAIYENIIPNILTFPFDMEKFYGETVFVAGGLSQYLRPVDEKHILKMFPNSSFFYIKGAGHWLHFDNPVEFVDTVISQL